jgi:transposase InsO family protein
VLDVGSRRIVGWQFASDMRTTLVLDALRMARSTRPAGVDAEIVHHSDRGSQYLSYDYTRTLTDHGVRSPGFRGASAARIRPSERRPEWNAQRGRPRRTQDASTSRFLVMSPAV